MAINFLVDEKNLSVRRACDIIGMSRSTYQYEPVVKDVAEIIEALHGLIEIILLLAFGRVLSV